MPLKLLVSWWQVRAILERFHPHVVVGVGGYASGPMVAVAARAGIPTLIHEANVRPGIANGLLSRWVDVICVGFESASAYFPVARTVFTGNPIRDGLSTWVPLAKTRATFGLAPGVKTLLVMGGSLGARHLNAWVLGNQRRFAARGVQVLWQSGRAHFEACQRELVHAEGVRLVPFIDDIATAYATADLVLASAGALTLAELAVLEKPVILVPDRNVSEDHQTSNAQELQRRGAAICHAGELGGDAGDSLFELVAALIHDQQRLRALGTGIGKLGKPDAGTRIVAQVARLAGLGMPAPMAGGDA